MSRIDPVTFFDQKVADNYDSRADKMAIMRNLHLLIDLVLQELPDDARILCIGAGTGTEIVALGEHHPNWQFVAIEPSEAMFEKCQSKIEENGLSNRCNCVHGYLSDLDTSKTFDAILCLLVTQFILDTQERQAMFDNMAQHLCPGGYLINAEISYDIQSVEFDEMARKWIAMHQKMGSLEENGEKMISMTKQHVAIVPPPDIESMLKQSGFTLPMLFFQSLFIHAWYSQK